MFRLRRYAVPLCILLLIALSAHKARAEEEEEYDAEEVEEEGAEDGNEVSEVDVVVLGNTNFTDVIGKTKFALVEFYAPWCGHCKSLKPEYAKAATALKKYDPEIVIAKVDATAESEVASKYDVKGYPTLKWFVDGKDTEYNGGRTSDTIVSWIKKRTGPPAETVDDASKLDTIKADNEVFVLGYFESFEGENFEAFLAVAREADDPPFFQTTNAEVAKALGLTKPGFAVGKTYGEFESVTSEGNSAFTSDDELKEQLSAFITAEKLPLYFEFNPTNQQKIFGSGVKKHVLVVGKEAKVDESVLSIIKAVAPKHKGQIMFVTTISDSQHGKAVLDYFGLEAENDEIQVVGFDMEASKKFKYKDIFGEKELDTFAAGVADGTLEPDFKSDPIPEGADAKDGDVVVVVGKSFDSIVKDPKKDVLLEVYAPWCGHCKSLAPIWKKLAKRFRKVDSVVIAKLDGTTNEHKELKVEGFPTLVFYPAGEDAEPIPYDGERNLKDMTKWIKKNAKVPFELQKKKKSDDDDEESNAKDEL